MILSDILKELNNRDFDVIEYRYINSDMLYGFATYKNKMLTSVDGGTYHLNDKIIKYELYKKNWLVVWI